MTAESDIAAIDNGGANTSGEVRTALTSVLARADLGSAGCALTMTVDQENISTPAAAISFDSELWDDDGWHSIGTNPTRVTPGAAGRYHVEGILGVGSAVVNQEHTYSIAVNGAAVAQFALFSVGAAAFSRSFALELELANPTDYIELLVERTSGTGDFDVLGTALYTRLSVAVV